MSDITRMIERARQGDDAASEQLAIHVDMGTRRSAPFSEAMQARFEAVMARHGALDVPERAGRRIGIERRPSA